MVVVLAARKGGEGEGKKLICEKRSVFDALLYGGRRGERRKVVAASFPFLSRVCALGEASPSFFPRLLGSCPHPPFCFSECGARLLRASPPLVEGFFLSFFCRDGGERRVAATAATTADRGPIRLRALGVESWSKMFFILFFRPHEAVTRHR